MAWATAIASPMSGMSLDVGNAQLRPIPDDEDRERYVWHFECLAGRGNASLCDKLEQQARQKQVEKLRESVSPAPIPKPFLPENTSQGSVPLYPSPPDQPTPFEIPTGK